MKTTKSEVDKAVKEFQEAFQYHHSLPENEQWKNGENLNKFRAKAEMLSEAYKMGM